MGRNNSGGLQVAISTRNGIGVHPEVLMERTNSGELIPRPQSAGSDGRLHVVHDLLVDRNSGMKFKTPGRKVHVCYYTSTLRGLVSKRFSNRDSLGTGSWQPSPGGIG